MYTEYVDDMGYYLAGVDIEDVRSRLACLQKYAVVIEPVDYTANATVVICARPDWVSKEEIEDLLGTPLINEEDIELTDDYTHLNDLFEHRVSA